MGRLVAASGMIVMLACSCGCGLGPRNFRQITHPAPLVRARAISMGRAQPDSVVIPILVGRLNDSDVVVRLAAHEELKRRTGRDFGYLPWASPEERSGAVNRWSAWLSGHPSDRQTALGQPRKSLPRPSPQGP
jgi:hypothetical protein